MLKRILVPVDASEFTKAATRMAAGMANREAAAVKEPVTVTGLGIVDTDQMPSGRFASVVPREQIIGEAEAKVEELLRAFQEDAQSLGLTAQQIECQSAAGSPFRQIIRESVFCDLIVMGEKCSFPPVNQDYDTMHNLYHEASRPILLTEEGFQTVDKVVMAMDGTAPSSRMMYNFVHLDPFPGAEVILVHSKKEEEQYHLEKYFKRVEDFLTSYHIKVRSDVLEGEIDDEIAGFVNGAGAQILALGIHREHFMDRFRDPLRLRENFATRLLRSMHASLFVVH